MLSKILKLNFLLGLTAMSLAQASDNVRAAVGNVAGSEVDDPKSVSSKIFNFINNHPKAIAVGTAVVVGAGVLLTKERGLRLREGAGPHAFPGLLTILRSHATPYVMGPLSGFAARLMMSAPNALAESEKTKQEAKAVRDQAVGVQQAVLAESETLKTVDDAVRAIRTQGLNRLVVGVGLSESSMGGLSATLIDHSRLTGEKLAALDERLAAVRNGLAARSTNQVEFGRVVAGQNSLFLQLSGISSSNLTDSQNLSKEIEKASIILSPDTQDKGL